MDYDENALNSLPTMGPGGDASATRPPFPDEPSLGSAPTMAPGRDASTTRPPPSLGQIDQYQLVRKLGGGGFGVVYLAHDTISGVDVALKTLHPLLKSNSEEMEGLRAKFALVSRLTHQNIAKALGLHLCNNVNITDDEVRHEMRLSPGDFVMVMDFASGVTLSKWRKQFPGGIVPLDLALEVGRQIAAALDYAHGERIVHRDVKPANVMVETLPEEVSQPSQVQSSEFKVQSSGEPTLVTRHPSLVTSRIRVRILDFGLAAEIRSSMSRVSTETGDTSGTRPYMAPEQWLGKKQDGRTDQYALACVLYELLSGAPPFAGVFETGDPAIMKDAVVRDAPDEMEGVPPHVNAALKKALAKDPKERFASCAEFVGSCLTRSSQSPQSGRRGRSELVNAAKPESRTQKSDEPSVAPPRHRTVWPWVVAALIAGAAVVGVKMRHDEAISKRKALQTLATLKSDADTKVAEANAYSKWRDGPFGEKFEAMREAKKRLDAISDPKDLQTAHDLKSQLDDMTDWIVENGPKREALSAKEADIRMLVPELEQVSASSLATGTYNEAKDAEKRAKTLCARGDFYGASKAYDEAEGLFRKAIVEAKAEQGRWDEEARQTLATLKSDANKKVAQANAHSKWLDGLFGEKFETMRGAKTGLDAISDPKGLQNAQKLKSQLDEAAEWIVENGPKREALSVKEAALRKLVPELEQVSASSLAPRTYNEAKRETDRAKTLGTRSDYDAAGNAYDKAEGLFRKAIDEAKVEQKRRKEAADKELSTIEMSIDLLLPELEKVEASTYATGIFNRALEARTKARQLREQGNYTAARDGLIYAKEQFNAAKDAATSNRRIIKVGEALGSARAAKSNRDWNGVIAAAHRVFEWEPENDEAVALKREAEDKIAEAGADTGKGTSDYFGRNQFPQSDMEKVSRYRKAAERGDVVAQYNLGFAYYKGRGVSKDYNEAAKWFRRAAERGDVDALYALGYMYDDKDAHIIDYAEAAKWYRMAAEHGNVDAQARLAYMYDQGIGISQNYNEAFNWYRKAAKKGDAVAQNNLGYMYEKGHGIPQDYKEAVRWYRKSAEQGWAAAQGNLGYMYEKGHGVPQDYKEAVRWFRKAAEQGEPVSQKNLGVMYEKGHGVPQNDAEAVKWYRKAAEQGNEDAKKALRRRGIL